MVFAVERVSELQRPKRSPSPVGQSVRRQFHSLQYPLKLIYTRLLFLGLLRRHPDNRLI